MTSFRPNDGPRLAGLANCDGQDVSLGPCHRFGPTAASARNLVRFKHLDFAMRRRYAESLTAGRQYEASSLNGYLRARSWMHVRRVAEVETDRFHHPERRARGEDIGCRQDVPVLLDHRRGGGVGEGVEIALHTCPGV